MRYITVKDAMIAATDTPDTMKCGSGRLKLHSQVVRLQESIARTVDKVCNITAQPPQYLTPMPAMQSSQELQTHPHTNYADVYFEKHLNQAVARSYRQCQLKSRRVDDLRTSGGSQCTMCSHRTFFRTIKDKLLTVLQRRKCRPS